MKNLRKLERPLKALANVKRLHILSFLKKSDSATVSEIATAIRMKQQATSKHLQILINADLVERRKRGLYVFYRPKLSQEQPVKQVISHL